MKKLIEKLKIYGLRKFIYFAILELRYILYYQKVLGSYSQRKEDLLIERLLKDVKKGFYVDIGAYDPNRFSNTKRFYLRGWRGINIDPNTKSIEKFKSERPLDKNLNIGIGSKNAELTFYEFLPATLSTFSASESKKYIEQGYKLKGDTKVPVLRLADVLEKHGRKKIHFMTIDTEGYDLEVLKSNDWGKFRPKVICIESVEHKKTGTQKSRSSPIEKLLTSNGYQKVFDTGLNDIYAISCSN